MLIIGNSSPGGGHGRMLAYKDFLQSKNHNVSLIQLPSDNFSGKLWFYYQRFRARLQDHEKRYIKKTADLLEKRIKKGQYDVVIGVETPLSYVFTRDLGCLKIFSCEALEADQLYFSKKFGNLDRIHSLREMEIEILQKSDHVIFPWKTTENYVRKYVWNGDNFVTIKYGCYPQEKVVSYFFPMSIVSLGTVGFYWSNRELLSYLTHISPYTVDVYSRHKPPGRYRLNYKGFASSLDVLYSYQFGLNTVSKDVFRQNHFSSRPLGYLSYGLPVLSPDWLQLSKELKGCIPYNENNFIDLVDKYSDKESWEKLSKAAIDQARELDWRKTLEPLEDLVTQSN